jgi:ZIP family zinc transporter
MLQKIILLSGFSGITIFIGGLLAYYFNHHVKESPVKKEIIQTMMSFGAGIILSALSLVLIPKGMEELNLLPMAISFVAGAVTFLFIDLYLKKKVGQTATLLAMMLDFVPEAIVLGAVFVIDPNMATLLAIFIGLQNLPESFNAFRDLIQSGFTVKKTLVTFFFLSFFGIIAALSGHFLLSDYPNLTAHLMIFASGGILYLLIEDIIPESNLEKSYFSSLGATFGFLAGIIGDKII